MQACIYLYAFACLFALYVLHYSSSSCASQCLYGEIGFILTKTWQDKLEKPSYRINKCVNKQYRELKKMCESCNKNLFKLFLFQEYGIKKVNQFWKSSETGL